MKDFRDDIYDSTMEHLDENNSIKKDNRSIWCIVRQEGALLACDSICDKLKINWLFPIKYRYDTLYYFLRWYGDSKVGRWLNRNTNRGFK